VEIYAKEFCLPKNGNTEAENDDSFSSAKDKSRFAVADGASIAHGDLQHGNFFQTY
jgi:hypothetical protein